jgi:hypothetical protein
MPRNDDVKGGGFGLSGPKQPMWGCPCGEPYNWACRAQCRNCGSRGPNKAGNHYNKTPSKWEQGPPKWLDSSKGELARLKQEIFDLKQKQSKAEPDGKEAHQDDSGAERDKIQKAYEQSLAILGAEDPTTQGLKKRLDEAKGARPPLPRLQAARRQVDKVEKKLEAAAASIDSKQKLIVKTQSDLAELRTKQAEMQVELLDLKKAQAEAANDAQQEAVDSLGLGPAVRTAHHKAWIDSVLEASGDQGTALLAPIRELLLLADKMPALVKEKAASAAGPVRQAQPDLPKPAEKPEDMAVDSVDVEEACEEACAGLDEEAWAGLPEGAKRRITDSLKQSLKHNKFKAGAAGSRG